MFSTIILSKRTCISTNQFLPIVVLIYPTLSYSINSLLLVLFESNLARVHLENGRILAFLLFMLLRIQMIVYIEYWG